MPMVVYAIVSPLLDVALYETKTENSRFSYVLIMVVCVFSAGILHLFHSNPDTGQFTRFAMSYGLPIGMTFEPIYFLMEPGRFLFVMMVGGYCLRRKFAQSSLFIAGEQERRTSVLSLPYFPPGEDKIWYLFHLL